MKNIFLSVIIILFTGCATIIQPGPDRVMVTTEPAGAKIFLDEQPVGVTPTLVHFNRAGEGRLRVEKAGYQTVVFDKDKVVAGWVFLDLLFWPSFIVDFATHNQGKYSEDPIHLPLSRGEDPKSSH